MYCYNYEIDNEIPSLGQIAEAALSIQDGTASQNPATASHFQVDIHAGIVLSRPVSSDTSQAAHDGIALPGRAGRHPFLATPYGGTAHYSHGLPADNVHGMEGGVEFLGDPRYSNPQQLVFAGRLYEKTSLQLVQLQRVRFAFVVPLEQQDHDIEEVDEAGPQFVVMNGTVYQESSLIPSCQIGDWVLRTAKWARQAAPHHPTYIARPPRVMPSRSLVTDNESLQDLFDLPVANRQGIQIVKPSHKNPTRPGTTRGKTPRYSWAAAHQNYLFEVMELAMLLLNRPLRFHDFEAITEALNREFRGTIVEGIAYAERGVNPVNTYVMKGCKQRYDALVRGLFPSV